MSGASPIFRGEWISSILAHSSSASAYLGGHCGNQRRFSPVFRVIVLRTDEPLRSKKRFAKSCAVDSVNTNEKILCNGASKVIGSKLYSSAGSSVPLATPSPTCIDSWRRLLKPVAVGLMKLTGYVINQLVLASIECVW